MGARKLLAALCFVLLLSGCATEQPLLPSGANTQELVSAIATQGRGDGSPGVAPQPQPGGLLSANASSSPALASPGINAVNLAR
jgi:hypothetical protein